jgi:hypothetical protein
MKRVMFVLFFLLLTAGLIQNRAIVSVEASPDIYQGDLILNGNNVTVIEGRFDINGSIIVEENATLILRNALLSFTQIKDQQFNITFRYPVDGNPKIVLENSTIATNDYWLVMNFFGNSTALISNLTASKLWIDCDDNSSIAMLDSIIPGVEIGGDGAIELSNCTISDEFYADENANVRLLNCNVMYVGLTGESDVLVSESTISGGVGFHLWSVNCSISELKPGFFSYWNFLINCSVVTTPSSWAQNLTLVDSNVGGWSFWLYDFSNVTVSKSEIRVISLWSGTSASIFDSSITISAWGTDDTIMRIYNSSIYRLEPRESARFWQVNSTVSIYDIREESEVYVCWYLDVQVIDSIGQDVPAANVTATFPNATTAESKLTDIDGWARLTLGRRC